MDTFLTWEVLLTFSGLVGAVYMVVEFTKEIKFINKIPTKYWSFFISFAHLNALSAAANAYRNAASIDANGPLIQFLKKIKVNQKKHQKNTRMI